MRHGISKMHCLHRSCNMSHLSGKQAQYGCTSNKFPVSIPRQIEILVRIRKARARYKIGHSRMEMEHMISVQGKIKTELSFPVTGLFVRKYNDKNGRLEKPLQNAIFAERSKSYHSIWPGFVQGTFGQKILTNSQSTTHTSHTSQRLSLTEDKMWDKS